ncbi:MAG: murein L,D-transpeptidase catalytic domain family protein [Bacteroidota bacterium]
MKIGFMLFFCMLCFNYACNTNTSESKGDLPELSTANIIAGQMYKEQKKLYRSIDSLQLLLPKTCEKFGLNETLVLIAHLGIHSGLPRMVLLNLNGKQVLDSGLVAHGYGEVNFSKTVVFSNQPNSYCSSKGIYKIGAKYKGSFGWSYKLHGLEKTNSKAFERFIVLHPYECVPLTNIFPAYCCNSQGCPMVNPLFMKRLEKRIDGAKKPVMLWVIE